jgi:uncharacterized membrane protein
MSTSELALAASVFLACAVEAVEALTIVLAVGSSRSWRSALAGVGAALVALAVVIAVVGAGLNQLPFNTLRVLVGVLLLLFGLQWLRKAVLREAGRKAMRDETRAYSEELQAAREAARGAGAWDPYSFAVAGKGVLLEGLEVALIVVTFGAGHHTALAAGAAGVAVACVLLAGLAARRPLARVPENTMKYAVGVLLSAYGIFWGGEGAGVSWPGGEAMLGVLIFVVLAISLGAVRLLRRRAEGRIATAP